MANTNRDILMTIDVKTSKVSGGGFSFFVTDQNTSNFFVRLVMSMSTNAIISQYVSLEQASNYQIKLYIIKPNGSLISIDGTLMDEKNALFQFNLPNDYKDFVGEYTCEFQISSTVNGGIDVITTDPFKYIVKPSILNDIGQPVDAQGEPVVLMYDSYGNLVVTIDGETRTFSSGGGTGGLTIVDSIDKMTDTSQQYVLSTDGYIYHYVHKEGTKANYTNQIPISIDSSGAVYHGVGYADGIRVGSDGTERQNAPVDVTGYIPMTKGQIIYFKNCTILYDSSVSYQEMAIFDSNKVFLGMVNLHTLLPQYVDYVLDENNNFLSLDSTKFNDMYNTMGFVRIQGNYIGADSIITVDEEIVNITVDEYMWESTGIPYSTGGGNNTELQNKVNEHEDRITDLENDVDTLMNTSTPVADGIPTYVKTESKEVADRVIDKQTINSLTMIMSADIHMSNNQQTKDAIKHMGQGMNEIQKYAHVDGIAFLGDYNYDNNATSCIELVKEFQSYVADATRGIPTIYTLGNHDYSTISASDIDNRLSENMVYALIGSHTTDRAIVDKDNLGRNYGYVDFEKQRIRFIYLNTEDISGVDYTSHLISTPQGQWLIQKGLDLSDKEDEEKWGIVVAGHVPLHTNPQVPTVLSNFKKRLSGGNFGTTYNFANAKAELICVFTGHIHNFKVYEKDTIKYITIPNAVPNRENPYATTDYYNDNDTAYTKTKDTAEDTSFNVIVIDKDNKKIHAINYGAGIDREIYYGEEQLPDNIPSYHGEEITRVAQEITQLKSEYPNSIVFGTISDNHVDLTNQDVINSATYGAYALGRVGEKANVDFIANLGDNIVGTNIDSDTEYANFKYMEEVTTYDSDVPFFNLVGNHCKSSSTQKIYDVIGAYNEFDVYSTTRIRGFGYKDFADKKVRVIVLNTCDYWNIQGGNGMSYEQKDFFMKALDLSAKSDYANWTIVVLSHIPLDFLGGDYNKGTDLKAILKAYNDGTTATITIDETNARRQNESDKYSGTLTYNYSGKNTPKVINIHGHVHTNCYGKLTFIDDNTTLNMYRMSTANSNFNQNASTDRYTSYGNYSITTAEASKILKYRDCAKDTSATFYLIDLDTKVIHSIGYGADINRELIYGNAKKFSVTYSLTDVSSSSSAKEVIENTKYTTTLSVADSNFVIDNVKVTMGGTDITSSCYSNGVITITSVTGDISITASAKDNYVPVWDLANRQGVTGLYESASVAHSCVTSRKNWIAGIGSTGALCGQYISDIILDGNNITFTSTTKGFCIGLPYQLEPNASYTATAKCTASDGVTAQEGRIRVATFDNTGLITSYTTYDSGGSTNPSVTFTAHSDPTYWTVIMLDPRNNGATIKFSNVTLTKN